MVLTSAYRGQALEPVASWRRSARHRVYAGYGPDRGKLAGMWEAQRQLGAMKAGGGRRACPTAQGRARL